jgi:hypothetical protein
LKARRIRRALFVQRSSGNLLASDLFVRACSSAFGFAAATLEELLREVGRRHEVLLSAGVGVVEVVVVHAVADRDPHLFFFFL